MAFMVRCRIVLLLLLLKDKSYFMVDDKFDSIDYSTNSLGNQYRFLKHMTFTAAFPIKCCYNGVIC